MSARFHILVVEDNEADASLLVYLFREYNPSCELICVSDGQSALKYLESLATDAGLARPDLILLDLNIPRINGRELLKILRNREAFCRIPVVVLSTSTNETDVAECYALGAACFISKALDIESVQRMVENLSNFWFSTVRLPGRPNSPSLPPVIELFAGN